MSKNLELNIPDIKQSFFESLKNKFIDNIEVVHDNKTNTIQLQIHECNDESTLINSLENFIDNLEKPTSRQIAPTWFFDEDRALILNSNESYELTLKEALFLNMLLKNNKIITYSQMYNSLWEEGKITSKNAIRVFIKNIKKKLPPHSLTNIQNIGYKLVI